MLQEINSQVLRGRVIFQLGRFIYEALLSFMLIIGILYIFEIIGLKYCWECLIKFVM